MVTDSGNSVEFKTWVLDYFVNASRGWMITCNMLTNVVTILRKVTARAAQMDFSTTIVTIVVLQDLIGHFAPLALEFGVKYLFVFVVSFHSFLRIANYFTIGGILECALTM